MEPFGNCNTDKEIEQRNMLMQKQEYNSLVRRYETGPKQRIALMLHKTPYENFHNWQGVS